MGLCKKIVLYFCNLQEFKDFGVKTLVSERIYKKRIEDHFEWFKYFKRTTAAVSECDLVWHTETADEWTEMMILGLRQYVI